MTLTKGVEIALDIPSNMGGTPATYEVSPALPAGLGLDPFSGTISGTPVAYICKTIGEPIVRQGGRKFLEVMAAAQQGR